MTGRFLDAPSCAFDSCVSSRGKRGVTRERAPAGVTTGPAHLSSTVVAILRSAALSRAGIGSQAGGGGFRRRGADPGAEQPRAGRGPVTPVSIQVRRAPAPRRVHGQPRSSPVSVASAHPGGRIQALISAATRSGSSSCGKWPTCWPSARSASRVVGRRRRGRPRCNRRGCRRYRTGRRGWPEKVALIFLGGCCGSSAGRRDAGRAAGRRIRGRGPGGGQVKGPGPCRSWIMRFARVRRPGLVDGEIPGHPGLAGGEGEVPARVKGLSSATGGGAPRQAWAAKRSGATSATLQPTAAPQSWPMSAARSSPPSARCNSRASVVRSASR